jgi:hypothetical protein
VYELAVSKMLRRMDVLTASISTAAVHAFKQALQSRKVSVRASISPAISVTKLRVFASGVQLIV